jgi:uncharacterized membrane protein YbhN (UPF0104 family)
VTRSSWWWALAALALAAGLRYVVRFPWADTWFTLTSADWRLLAWASGANLLSLACKAWGWHLLLPAPSAARMRTTQAATFAGAAVGSFSVAMSGEATRVHLLSTWDGVEPATAARTIAASRLVEAGALGVFLLAFAAGTSATLAWQAIAGAMALTAAALVLLRRVPWLRPAHPSGAGRLGWSDGRLLAALAFGMAGWTLQWATYHWSIAATHAAVTPSASMLALLLANLGGILRLTPGNVGVVQGAVALGLAPAGVPVGRAVAAGLALQAVQVVPVLLVGLLILGRHGMRVPLRRAVEPA